MKININYLGWISNENWNSEIEFLTVPRIGEMIILNLWDYNLSKRVKIEFRVGDVSHDFFSKTNQHIITIFTNGEGVAMYDV